jgi:uncharacterized damage-inducible protein DinB
MKRMHGRWSSGVVAALVVLASGMAAAQMGGGAMGGSGQRGVRPPAGPAGEVQGSYARIKTNVIKAAEEMPAESYTYKMFEDVRTYGRIVNHVTEAQTRSCTAMNGKPASAAPKVPADTAGKDEIVAALKASFAECDAAYAGATDANMLEMVAMGQAKRSRAGVLWGNVSHDTEQYAQMALYLRGKGLVPPSSEK